MESGRQPAAAAAVAVSKVLDDDDLLIEILHRVGFPTTLVRAALVCKRWLGHVSDRAFLRRFRELHPPRLLGFYIQDRALPIAPPRFVPVLPQPPELAAVILRARFSLEAYDLPSLNIHDCRNGSVFIHWYDRESNSLARVHNPLHPQRGPTILPSLPRCRQNRYCIIRQVLSQKDGDAMSYFCLHGESSMYAPESKFSVQVYRLQDGRWREKLHVFDMSQLPSPRCEPKAVLMDNKIYLPAVLGNIIVLDLTASSVSTIRFPPGVFCCQRGTTMLSRADDDSGLYLIQAKEFHLYIWLHKGDS
jgi:hypothetical protein